MRSVASVARISLLLTLALIACGTSALAAELNDYPTEARADYVFACMKTHGDTQLALRQCSCSIDVIATLLSYDRYVAAQTVLSLSQVPGPLWRHVSIARAGKRGGKKFAASASRSRGAVLLNCLPANSRDIVSWRAYMFFVAAGKRQA